jgi:hypothetical protein
MRSWGEEVRRTWLEDPDRVWRANEPEVRESRTSPSPRGPRRWRDGSCYGRTTTGAPCPPIDAATRVLRLTRTPKLRNTRPRATGRRSFELRGQHGTRLHVNGAAPQENAPALLLRLTGSERIGNPSRFRRQIRVLRI